MTDEQLYEAGDVAALVNRYREAVAAYCGKQIGDDAAGDDVAQAAFLKLGTFNPTMLLRPQLYKLAYELASEHRKRLRRERRELQSPEMQILAADFAK